MESGAAGHDELDYVGGGLPKTTNWWGAFVIGLAGTILVTGIAPVMVTSLGAAAIPSIFLITASGWLLCLFLGGALGDDARPLGRLARVRLPGLQGPLAALRRARQRLHGVGATGWAGSRSRR